MNSAIILKYIFMRGAPRPLKISALITFFGIVLAVAVLVVSMSVAGGFQSAYKRSILDFNAHLVILSESGEIPQYKKIAEKLKLFDGVVRADPFVYRESMVAGAGNIKGVVIKGVDSPDGGSMNIVHFDGVKKDDGYNAYLGSALAEKLNISGRSTINLMIGSNKFEKIGVVGIFRSGLYDYDSQFILMSIKDVQRLFKMKDEATGVEIKLSDPEDAAATAKMFEEEFPFPYQVMTWEELNRPIFEAVHMEKIMFAIIMGTLVLISMFNIISTLILRVIYRIKDIAIFSAIGMNKKTLRQVFTFHGVMLGMSATLTGALLGVITVVSIAKWKFIDIEPEIYFLSSLPVVIEWPVVMGVILAGTLVSLVVSYVAAGRIFALKIVDGLKEA